MIKWLNKNKWVLFAVVLVIEGVILFKYSKTKDITLLFLFIYIAIQWNLTRLEEKITDLKEQVEGMRFNLITRLPTNERK